MTRKDAEKILLKAYPDRMIEDCYLYKGDYLFIAPFKKLGSSRDFSNPYFIVNKRTGKISGFSPMDDFEGLDRAIENGSVK